MNYRGGSEPKTADNLSQSGSEPNWNGLNQRWENGPSLIKCDYLSTTLSQGVEFFCLILHCNGTEPKTADNISQSGSEPKSVYSVMACTKDWNIFHQ